MSKTNGDNKKLLSVVMPVYREASHISTTLAAIRNMLAEVDISFELFLVDAAS